MLFGTPAPFGRPSIRPVAPGSFAFEYSSGADTLTRVAALAAVTVWAARR